jgi:hypothetical protein
LELRCAILEAEVVVQDTCFTRDWFFVPGFVGLQAFADALRGEGVGRGDVGEGTMVCVESLGLGWRGRRRDLDGEAEDETWMQIDWLGSGLVWKLNKRSSFT